jgi:hypothetical protein
VSASVTPLADMDPGNAWKRLDRGTQGDHESAQLSRQVRRQRGEVVVRYGGEQHDERCSSSPLGCRLHPACERLTWRKEATMLRLWLRILAMLRFIEPLCAAKRRWKRRSTMPSESWMSVASAP